MFPLFSSLKWLEPLAIALYDCVDMCPKNGNVMLKMLVRVILGRRRKRERYAREMEKEEGADRQRDWRIMD